MSPSIWQLLIVAGVALLLFGGRGRISSMMEDLAKGITSFRAGLNEDLEEFKSVGGDEVINLSPEEDEVKSAA